MYHYVIYFVRWLVWYFKFKFNFGNRVHIIQMSLQAGNDDLADDNYAMTALGNGVTATFNNIQLNHANVNGIINVQTETDVVLPLTISTLTLTRLGNDEGNPWFVRWIEVDGGKRFIFNKWINQGGHSSRSDTLLPQDEGNQRMADTRMLELVTKSVNYGFQLYRGDLTLPVMITTLPTEEKFSWCYWLKNIIIPKFEMYLFQTIIIWRNWLPARWTSFEAIDTAYQMYFKTPKGRNLWRNDLHFAQQRLNQCNSSLIRQVQQLDEIENIIPVGGLINIADIDAQIGDGALFMTDINIPVNLAIPSPVVLFQMTIENGLLPVAIQLNISDGQQIIATPVFQPNDDPNAWMLAKMWSNVADASMHLGVVHLGLTHLLMEGVAICVHRNLSTRHPVYKLLAPHFYYNLAINELARKDLLGNNEYIDETMNIQADGVVQLLSQRLENWNLDTEGTLPEDLLQRGLIDANLAVNIPGFFYAEDGLQLYNAIHNYVDQYVRHYYSGVDEAESIDRLTNDNEIQAFRELLVRPRAVENGGIGIQGVPGNNDNGFETLEQLIDTLSSTISICTVMHAATNFPQYDEYGFPPNYTTILHNQPPQNANPIDDAFVLDCLPSVKETFDIMSIFTILSQETTKPLGYFEVQYIEDPDAIQILEAFRGQLFQIEQGLNERNQEVILANQNADIITQFPYTRLLPSNVPSSIAI